MSLKIDNVVLPSPKQWEAIIRGMRNPKNSWDRSDSYATHIADDETMETADYEFFIGDKDLKLMKNLASGGPVHAKYRRMIPVYLDITAPLYWWKEFDTYKIGTVANSCSTMHKIHEKEFTLEDFSHEHLISDWVGDNNDAMFYWRQKDTEMDLFASPTDGLKVIIGLLNSNREAYLKTNDKKYWYQMIQLLPTSYNQKRTVMLNYEVLVGIYKWRQNHKLDEWHVLCDWIETLPYSELITKGCDLGHEFMEKHIPVPTRNSTGPNGIVRTQQEIERDAQRANEVFSGFIDRW